MILHLYVLVRRTSEVIKGRSRDTLSYLKAEGTRWMEEYLYSCNSTFTSIAIKSVSCEALKKQCGINKHIFAY